MYQPFLAWTTAINNIITTSLLSAYALIKHYLHVITGRKYAINKHVHLLTRLYGTVAVLIKVPLK